MDACQAIRRIDPEARVLLFSGHIRDERVETFVRESALPFLQKPFALEELARAVADAFERGA